MPLGWDGAAFVVRGARSQRGLWDSPQPDQALRSHPIAPLTDLSFFQKRIKKLKNKIDIDKNFGSLEFIRTCIFNVCVKFLSRSQELEGPAIEPIEQA